MPSKKPSNEWTKARFETFIRSILRQGFRKYPPKAMCLKEASVGKKVNKATKRVAEHYKCNACENDFPLKAVNVDHIEPVTSTIDGFKGWDDYIKRLFCDKSNLQVLCHDCHDIKSASENEVRYEAKRERKKLEND